MLKQTSKNINSIKDGDEISLSLPVGSDTFDVTGIVHFNDSGDIVITANPFGNDNFSFTSGTVTIKRKNGTFDTNDLDIVIAGEGKSGEVSEEITDFQINIKDGNVTLTNAPTGLQSGTYAISEDNSFKITDSSGNVIALADDFTADDSAIITSSGDNTALAEAEEEVVEVEVPLLLLQKLKILVVTLV